MRARGRAGRAGSRRLFGAAASVAGDRWRRMPQRLVAALLAAAMAWALLALSGLPPAARAQAASPGPAPAQGRTATHDDRGAGIDVRDGRGGRIALRDDRGVTVVLPAPPRRVVSLLPSLTETVCALGECSRLVGTDRYSNWPAEVARLPKLGGLDDAHLEAIVALRPDLVLAAPSSRVVARLEALGLQVLVLESRNHADVARTLALLGAAFARPDAARRVAADIERDLRTAAARVPPGRRGQTVYFEVDPTPYAAGASSFVGETLARLGLANIVPAAMGPFPRLNPEFVARAQPELVMAGARTLTEMPRRPGWDRLAALRGGQVCGFDAAEDDLLVRAGPRLGAAALKLADCIAALPPPLRVEAAR